MKIDLTEEAKALLEAQHKQERDGRVRDRIKAVLLKAEDWSQVQIAQALRIRHETVGAHLAEYVASQKLKPVYPGSPGKLSKDQKAELVGHLEAHTYTKVQEICAHVKEKYGVTFSVSGMTFWLRTHGFTYKKPKGTPAKADPVKQSEFVAQYQALWKSTPEDEPILFGDGVHPTMATKVSYGWIRKGADKLIATTGNKTRVNIMGTLNLETMEVITSTHKTINSAAMNEHFKQLRAAHAQASQIHLILDRGSYNTSAETREAASAHGIVLYHLPPYSPNLNPIERLWKVMNEHVRNNRFFASAQEFREAISGFFSTIWPSIAHSMPDRINDCFQIVKTVN